MTVRTAYDLKPCHPSISTVAVKRQITKQELTSITISVIRMIATPIQPHQLGNCVHETRQGGRETVKTRCRSGLRIVWRARLFCRCDQVFMDCRFRFGFGGDEVSRRGMQHVTWPLMARDNVL